MANDEFIEEGEESDKELWLQLSRSEAMEFEETGNPVAAMRSFLAAYTRNEAPPQAVKNWLARGFEGYLYRDKDLYDSFELKQAKGTYCDEYKDMLMREISMLMEMFDLTKKRAIHLVVQRLRRLADADEDRNKARELRNQLVHARRDNDGRIKTYEYGSLDTEWKKWGYARYGDRKLPLEEKERIWKPWYRRQVAALYPEQAWDERIFY